MAFIVLTGPPGSGKTEVGAALALHYGLEFCDIDRLIVESASLSISEIFARHGEAEFRRLEQISIDHTLQDFSGIVALGGGAVLSEHTRKALLGLFVVYLKVSPLEAVKRIRSQPGSRPLFADLGPDASKEAYLQKWEQLLEKRNIYYEEVASVAVDTTRKGLGLIIAEISAQKANWDSYQTGIVTNLG